MSNKSKILFNVLVILAFFTAFSLFKSCSVDEKEIKEPIISKRETTTQTGAPKFFFVFQSETKEVTGYEYNIKQVGELYTFESQKIIINNFWNNLSCFLFFLMSLVVSIWFFSEY